MKNSVPIPDHYATLGLDRRCTRDQVRAAYRLLVKRHHPDVDRTSGEATRRAQDLNAAHEVLSDPARRAAYDREWAETKKTKGEAGRVSRLERNIAQDVFLRVEDFLRGASLQVRVNDPANPGGAEVYPLTIPEDTAPGQRFRIPRDDPFSGGFVVVRAKVMPGPRFKARGSDLRTDLRISPQRAAQGGTEMMPGPLGRMIAVPIPAAAARGAIVRIANQGLPRSRGGRGDLLVRLSYRPEVRITRR